MFPHLTASFLLSERLSSFPSFSFLWSFKKETRGRHLVLLAPSHYILLLYISLLSLHLFWCSCARGGKSFRCFPSSPLELLSGRSCLKTSPEGLGRALFGTKVGGLQKVAEGLEGAYKPPQSLREVRSPFRYGNTGTLSLPLLCPSSSSSSFLFLSHSTFPTLCLSLSLIHFHLFPCFSPCPTLHTFPVPSDMRKHQKNERRR